MNRGCGALVVLAAAGLGGCGGGPRETVTVYAAASLGPALEEIGAAYEAGTGVRIVGDWAASSVLARRVGGGGPGQIFISASPEWMDRLAETERLVPGSRVDLLGNSLVLVAPPGRRFRAEGASGLASAFEGRLALADPDHVPAGIYAKQALQATGDWEALAPRIVPAADVRAALRLVERGECAAGIVYRTDALGPAGVELVAEIPSDRHRPVVYPAALVRHRAAPAAEAFYRHLQSPAAREIFRRHGFVVPPPAAEAEPAAAPGGAS